jgi:hypothetical protein
MVPPVKATLPKMIEVEPHTRVLSTSKKAATFFDSFDLDSGTG